jgi:RNA polymerase sigma-70 factor (ECF subfamily)
MDEKYLINELKNKNKVVFDFVFTYYYSGLCAYARRWVIDEDTAEDLVQDFFVHLWIEGHRLEITSSLKSYLFASIRNRSINYLKHNQVKKRYENYITKQHSESLQFTEWEFTEAEIIELVEKTMEKLPPRCREVFCLSRFEGKNNAAIAEMLDISKRTVELQISNALKILRTELKDYLPLVVLLWLLK